MKFKDFDQAMDARRLTPLRERGKPTQKQQRLRNLRNHLIFLNRNFPDYDLDGE